MRTAIATPSAEEASVLEELLRHVPSAVAWVERDATAAAARSRADPPDVLLVSARLGAGLVKDVMAARPCSTLVTTTDLSRDVHDVYAALAAGALDVVAVPATVGELGRGSSEGRLVAALRRLGSAGPSRARTKPRSPRTALVIGASTGGPQALAQVLASLPSGFRTPTLLAQHMDDEFVRGFADFLTQGSGRKVEVAGDGTPLEAGRIFLVRSARQAIVDAAGTLRYHPAEAGNPFHPCIDTLFSSLVRSADARGVAVLLTGMGSDGAKGLLALRHAGWTTIAQDATSSVVFGMPKAAAALGAATRVVSLEGIAAAAAGALSAMEGQRPG